MPLRDATTRSRAASSASASSLTAEGAPPARYSRALGSRPRENVTLTLDAREAGVAPARASHASHDAGVGSPLGPWK